MIEIVRDGCIVEIRIDTDLPYNLPYDEEASAIFSFGCKTHDVQSAELLKRYLKKRLNDRIQVVRRNEFFSGWREAKAKKHGKDYFNWFFSNLRPNSTNG